jgi:hypothetical protein
MNQTPLCVCACVRACMHDRQCVRKWMIYIAFIVSEIHQWYTLWKKYISARHSLAVLPQWQGLFSVALHCHSGWESLDTQPTQKQQSSSCSHFTGGSHHNYYNIVTTAGTLLHWLQSSMCHSQTWRQCCWMYVTKKLTPVIKYWDTSPSPKGSQIVLSLTERSRISLDIILPNFNYC